MSSACWPELLHGGGDAVILSVRATVRHYRSGRIEIIADPPQVPPSPDQAARWRARLDACAAHGIALPKDPRARMPPGIAKLAATVGISRQAYTQDLRLAIAWQATA